MSSLPDHLTLEAVCETLRQASELVYDWDIATDELKWSPGAASLLKVAEDRISSGLLFGNIIDPDSPNTRHEAIFSSAVKDNGRGVNYTAEYKLETSGKERYWVHDSGVWHSNEKGEPVRARGIVRLFPENQQNFQGGQLSPFDPLTGQLNAIRLFDRLQSTIDIAEANGKTSGFLLTAVNNLSIINEAYGFEAADVVIAAVGQKLAANLRGRDTVGRYSGNKFGVVLPGCDDAEMKIAADRLISAIESEPVILECGQINVSLSVGGVIVPRYARDARQAMLNAHEALYRVKADKSIRYTSYTQSSASITRRQENLKIADEIIHALNEQRVHLHYQPVVDARTSAPFFHECLLKIQTEEEGLRSAQNYIEAAEKLELVHLLDCRVLEMASAKLFATPSERFSVNISAKTANDPDWMMLLAAIRRNNGSFDKRLIVEITETAAMHDIEDAARFVATLQDMGCMVAIDDFGAGYTCFRHLRQLKPDMIKIDGTFVQGLHRSRENQVFCKALVDIAKAFDIMIVAEFVETEEDAQLLRSWGVDLLQGFLFAKGAEDLQLLENEAARKRA